MLKRFSRVTEILYRMKYRNNEAFGKQVRYATKTLNGLVWEETGRRSEGWVTEYIKIQCINSQSINKNII